MPKLLLRSPNFAILLAIFALAGCGDATTNKPAPVTPEPEYPAPEVAGTPETDALANAPARCDQEAHTWLRSAELGKVTSFVTKGFYAQSVLSALVMENLPTLPAEVKYDVRAHIITYMTQDRGKMIEATALLAWPTSVPEDAEALPTLAVLHGTSGFKDGCGPSGDTDQAILAAALASTGYAVIVPDYIGLKNGPPETGFLHPYLSGQPTAIASLDAIRAVGQLPMDIREGGARPSARTVIVGGSQGGHAALWVDRLAPYYARELDIAGIATTVPPADLVTESELALTTFRESSANVVAFFSASAGWYGHADKLNEVLIPPLDVDVPAAMAMACDPTDPLMGKATLESVFQPALLSAAQMKTLPDFAPWGCMAAENGVTSTSVKRVQKDAASYGILYITGEKDTLVDTPTERASFETLCNAGMPMQYLECAGASHTKATTWSLPEILTFLGDRLAGKAFAKQCSAGAPVTCLGTPTP